MRRLTRSTAGPSLGVVDQPIGGPRHQLGQQEQDPGPAHPRWTKLSVEERRRKGHEMPNGHVSPRRRGRPRAPRELTPPQSALAGARQPPPRRPRRPTLLQWVRPLLLSRNGGRRRCRPRPPCRGLIRLLQCRGSQRPPPVQGGPPSALRHGQDHRLRGKSPVQDHGSHRAQASRDPSLLTAERIVRLRGIPESSSGRAPQLMQKN